MSCKCAKRTDEWHGWECTITEGPCEFYPPNSKACAEIYGEGPDAETENKQTIERYCNECELTTEHDIEENIEDDTKTTVAVCTVCGETDVDVDSIDLEYEESENKVAFEEVETLFEFLQGNIPEKITMKNPPKLNKQQAFNIIWYLQEVMRVIPDNYEQCKSCEELYDSDYAGCMAGYCDNCSCQYDYNCDDCPELTD